VAFEASAAPGLGHALGTRRALALGGDFPARFILFREVGGGRLRGRPGGTALGRVAQHLGDPLASLGTLSVDRGLHALAQVVGQCGRPSSSRGRAGTGLGRATFTLRQRAAFFTHTVPPAARTAGGCEPQSTAQHTTNRLFKRDDES
jgi:hypothetical protein